MDVRGETKLKLLEELLRQQAAGRAADAADALLSRHGLLDCTRASAAQQYGAAERCLASLAIIPADQPEDGKLAAAAGIAQAAAECSSQLFHQLLRQWIVALLVTLQAREQAVGSPLAAGCWHALGAIYRRLAELVELPGVRRDASQHAKELAQLLLRQEAGDAVVQAAQFRCLAQVLSAVPAALRGASKALEPLLAEALVSDAMPPAVRLAASAALARLQLTAGDGAAWAALMQRLILTSHLALDAAFLGLEDASLAASARASVAPNTSPLGQPTWDPAYMTPGKQQALLGVLGGLWDCCEQLLTSPQPAAAPLPAASMLTLLLRVLSFSDAAIPQGRVSQHEPELLALLRGLPALQACALKLLPLWLRPAGASLLPLHASVTRLLADLLARASAARADLRAPAQLRQQLFQTCAELVGLAGLGAARELLQPSLAAGLAEFLTPPSGAGASEQRPAKRRKKSKQKDADAQDLAASAAEAAQQVVSGQPLWRLAGAQAACLQLLSALRKNSAALSADERLQLDCLVLRAAEQSGAQLVRLGQEAGSEPCLAAALRVHLAALRALQASAVAPAEGRPVFMQQTLALLRQGLQSSHPEVAAQCADSLRAVAAVLQPRELPSGRRPVELVATGTVAALQGLAERVFSHLAEQRGDAAGAEEPEAAAEAAEAEAAAPMALKQRQELEADAGRPAAEATPAPRAPAIAAAAAQPAEAAAPMEVAPAEHQREAPTQAQPCRAEPHVSGAAPSSAANGSVWRAAEPPAVPAAAPVSQSQVKPQQDSAAGPRIVAAFAGDSDSEGPLPEIDSGMSSGEDS